MAYPDCCACNGWRAVRVPRPELLVVWVSPTASERSRVASSLLPLGDTMDTRTLAMAVVAVVAVIVVIVFVI